MDYINSEPDLKIKMIYRNILELSHNSTYYCLIVPWKSRICLICKTPTVQIWLKETHFSFICQPNKNVFVESQKRLYRVINTTQNDFKVQNNDGLLFFIWIAEFCKQPRIKMLPKKKMIKEYYIVSFIHISVPLVVIKVHSCDTAWQSCHMADDDNWE